jgi:hypothetical protein
MKYVSNHHASTHGSRVAQGNMQMICVPPSALGVKGRRRSRIVGASPHLPSVSPARHLFTLATINASRDDTAIGYPGNGNANRSDPSYEKLTSRAQVTAGGGACD